MSLWRLYYHFVWSTRDRAALISENIEAGLYGYIIGKVTALGAIGHAIGGTESHTHLVASVPPTLSLADFVKSIKGSSAHHRIMGRSIQITHSVGRAVMACLH